MRVIVTGAGGFIGRAVCAELALRGIECRGAFRNAPRGRDGITVGEVGPDTDWSRALQGFDTVLHLAGRAHRMGDDAATALEEFRHVNVSGSVRLLQQAADAGLLRMVFVSSVGVNGNRSSGPFTEDDPPNPQEPYAISKLEAEQQLVALAQRLGVELVIVRPPLVYGPSAPGNFGRLARLALGPWPLPFASLHNRRSFVGLQNLVDFLIRCLYHSGAVNRTFLVADGEDVSTPGLLRLMRQARGRPARLFQMPPALFATAAAVTGRQALWERFSGDLQVDASRSRILTHWSPPWTLEQGIQAAMQPDPTP